MDTFKTVVGVVALVAVTLVLVLFAVGSCVLSAERSRAQHRRWVQLGFNWSDPAHPLREPID